MQKKQLPFQEVTGYRDTRNQKSPDLGREEIGMHCLPHIVEKKKKKTATMTIRKAIFSVF